MHIFYVLICQCYQWGNQNWENTKWEEEYSYITKNLSVHNKHMIGIILWKTVFNNIIDASNYLIPLDFSQFVFLYKTV